jgi:glycosyltransferase involved in cell wall biosynthesis
MVNLLELGARPPIATILFQHNVESLIFARHAETARNPFKSILYRQQWRMLRAFERQSADFVDAQVTVSDNDTRLLRDDFGMSNVLGAVPTGVDCSYFTPGRSPEHKAVLAFLGSMDWAANQEAVDWFIEQILPRVWARVPATEFLIVGRNPPARLAALAAAEARIRITGTVADVRPSMQQATAMVLPLRVGGGTRIKIYEAMAMGVPVISTTIGAEGLDVEHGRNILLADTAQTFTDSAIRLLTEPKVAEELAAVAREHVADNYSWTRVAQIFSDYCAQAVQCAEPRVTKARA